MSADSPRRSKRGQDDRPLLHAAMVASTGYVAIKYIVLPALGAVARFIRGSPGPAPARLPSAAPVQAQGTEQVVELPKGEDRWKEFPGPVPPCPSDFKPIATAIMPCSVHDFYDHVLSGHSQFFPDTHARVGGQWDFTVHRYKAVAEGSLAPESDDNSLLGPSQSVFDFISGSPLVPSGYTRTITFINPKKPPSSVDSVCVQRQQVAAYEGGHLIFATAMNMLNIPFKDTFAVCTFWQVQPAPEGCSVTVSLKVRFLKRVLVGGIISATTFRDTAPFYRGFLEAAKIFIETQPPIRRGPVALLRQRSMAAGSLTRQPTLSTQRTGTASRINVALRRFGDGGTSDFMEYLPLTSKQIKTLFVVLVLTIILLIQVRMHRELHTHMLRGHT